MFLKNATVVLPDRTIEHGTVLIEEGFIAAVTENDVSQVGVETLDLGGLTLMPGFIDVHIHGAAGVDVMEATAEELAEVSRYLASQGITGWMPTFVPASDENYASAIAAIAQAMSDSTAGGARLLGVHYEGPFVNSAQC